MDPASAYRRTAGHSASPVHLVVMLYEQIVKDLGRAITALDNHDIPGRTREIDHALRVVGQLQGTLDMERGGDVARDLEGFYFMLRTRILDAQICASAEILRQQIAHLLLLRGAWTEVDQALANATAPPQRFSFDTDDPGANLRETASTDRTV